eukprot:Lankesteria_metandrocarpae@DN63_c0_g1_i1.p1
MPVVFTGTTTLRVHSGSQHGSAGDQSALQPYHRVPNGQIAVVSGFCKVNKSTLVSEAVHKHTSGKENKDPNFDEDKLHLIRFLLANDKTLPVVTVLHETNTTIQSTTQAWSNPSVTDLPSSSSYLVYPLQTATPGGKALHCSGNTGGSTSLHCSKSLQLPLKPCWAFTVHRAQGMTLKSALVSVDHLFAAGHAYVALSRVKTASSLRLVPTGATATIGTAAKLRSVSINNNCSSTSDAKPNAASTTQFLHSHQQENDDYHHLQQQYQSVLCSQLETKLKAVRVDEHSLRFYSNLWSLDQ